MAKRIAETLADGTPLRDYIYLDGEPIAVNVHQNNAGLYYYINDHLGTPQQLIDSAGTIVWQAAYLPFGEAQMLTEKVVNNLRFPGQYFDSETGLHYNWNRYYDPGIGRYISADPIGLNGGMNLYLYTENDPVNAVDPWGLTGEAVIPINPGPGGYQQSPTPELGGPGIKPVPTYGEPGGSGIIGIGLGISIGISEMAAPGDQVDTFINQKYGEYVSEEKLNCRPPKDRCDWLNENQHLFSRAAVKATQKAWGCRGSRAQKDKKR